RKEKQPRRLRRESHSDHTTPQIFPRGARAGRFVFVARSTAAFRPRRRDGDRAHRNRVAERDQANDRLPHGRPNLDDRGNPMKTLLINPPQAHFTQPLLALPSLAAYLRSNGVETSMIDASI